MFRRCPLIRSKLALRFTRERLEAEDFFPSPAWDAALNLIEAIDFHSGIAPLITVERVLPYLASTETAVRTDIDSLRQEYFTFSREERRRRWVSLKGKALPFPALLARLNDLQRGLDVDPNAVAAEKPVVRELVAHLCRLFTLSPAQRGLQRNLPPESVASPPRDWQLAALVLQKRYPEIANLDEAIVNDLCADHAAGRPIARVRRVWGRIRFFLRQKLSLPNGPKLIETFVYLFALLLSLLGTFDGLSYFHYQPDRSPLIDVDAAIRETMESLRETRLENNSKNDLTESPDFRRLFPLKPGADQPHTMPTLTELGPNRFKPAPPADYSPSPGLEGALDPKMRQLVEEILQSEPKQTKRKPTRVEP